MRETVRRQIGEIQILGGEDDDLAAVELRSVVGHLARRYGTLSLNKRFTSESEREILDAEEIVPVENRFKLCRLFHFLTVVVPVAICLDLKLNLLIKENRKC